MLDNNIYKESMEEATQVFNGVKNHDFTASQAIVYSKDFKTEAGFAYAMDMCGKYFKDKPNFVVMYSKPENKKTKEVFPNFTVRLKQPIV